MILGREREMVGDERREKGRYTHTYTYKHTTHRHTNTHNTHTHTHTHTKQYTYCSSRTDLVYSSWLSVMVGGVGGLSKSYPTVLHLAFNCAL